MSRTSPEDRITVKDALAIWSRSKSWFHGTQQKPGWRWTRAEELQLREGPPVTMSRKAVLQMHEELLGAPLVGRHPNAARLRGYSVSTTEKMCTQDTGGYGEQLAALCRGVESGMITAEEFKRAKADLSATAIARGR